MTVSGKALCAFYAYMAVFTGGFALGWSRSHEGPVRRLAGACFVGATWPWFWAFYAVGVLTGRDDA